MLIVLYTVSRSIRRTFWRPVQALRVREVMACKTEFSKLQTREIRQLSATFRKYFDFILIYGSVQYDFHFEKIVDQNSINRLSPYFLS